MTLFKKHSLLLGELHEGNQNLERFIYTLLERYPDLSIRLLPRMDIFPVEITSTSSTENINNAVNAIIDRFPNNTLTVEAKTLPEAIKKLFIKKPFTISTAESCTGGGIAKEIVSISGSSDYFIGGFVVYSNWMKQKLLNVPKEILQNDGAVSISCVEKMLEGLLSTTQTDWGIAVSGIAGPFGDSEEKPVGTVIGGLQHKNSPPQIWTMNLSGSREMIIQKSINRILFRLCQRLNSH